MESYIYPTSYADNQVVWEIDQLAPNGSGRILINFRLPLSIDVGELFTNAVEVVADQAEISLDDNRDMVTLTTVEGQPNLTISKYANGTVAPGEDLQYNINWHTDDGFARDVVITDVLPAELSAIREYHSVYLPGDSEREVTVYNDGQTITWTIGTTGPDSSGSMTVIGRIPSDFSGTLTNTATIAASNELNVTDNESTVSTQILSPAPDMYIDKYLYLGNVVADNDIRYRIYWQNQGTDVAPNVVVTDTLPSELSILSVNSYGYTPNYREIPTVINGNELRWELGNVPRNSYGYIDIYARIADDVTPGDTLFNEAFVSIAPNEVDVANNRESDSRTIQSPYTDLSVSKYVDNRFNRGNQVFYNLGWYNNGTAVVDQQFPQVENVRE